jgi:hypothetical protein
MSGMKTLRTYKKKGNKILIEKELAYIYANSSNDVFIIDTFHVEKVKHYTWHSENGYAVTNVYENGKRRGISMHRLIMGVLDEKEVHEVDHINHCRNDNRESNLRHCKGDAPNLANNKIQFWNHERLWIHRTKENTYILIVSDGRYMNVRLRYCTFEQALKVRKFLYDQGLADGIPKILSASRKLCLQILEKVEDGSREYHQCIQSLDYMERKYKEACQNARRDAEIQENLKEKIDNLKGLHGFIEHEGKVLVFFKDIKKSKDVGTKDKSFFRFIDGEVVAPEKPDNEAES